MLLRTVIQAGGRLEFYEQSDFFRMLEAVEPVSVRFYLDGKEVAAAEGVRGGYAEQFSGGFNRFVIESETEQEVQFVARLGNRVQYDVAPVGNVRVVNTGGEFAQQPKVVTDVAAELVPANGNRRYLLIQNKAAGGDIFVNVAGEAATAGNGILIVPGGSLELAGYVPVGAVSAVCSIPVNSEVLVVEG